MSTFGLVASRIRLAAMVALGAFAVHQLRYLVAFGDSSSEELAQRGHGYLETLLPALAVLGLAVLFATALGALTGKRPRRAAIALRALACGGALLSIFFAQELLEWALAPGKHASLAAAMLGGGAWVALPLSAALGTFLSLLLRGLEGVEGALAALFAPIARTRPTRSQGRARSAHGVISLRAPLAFGLARRPPPSVA